MLKRLPQNAKCISSMTPIGSSSYFSKWHTEEEQANDKRSAHLDKGCAWLGVA